MRPRPVTMAAVIAALACVLVAPCVVTVVLAVRMRQLCTRVQALERRRFETDWAKERAPRALIPNGPPAWVTDPEKWSRDEAGRRAVAESIARQEMDEHRRRLEEAAREAFMRKPGEDGEEEGGSEGGADEAGQAPAAEPQGHSTPPNLLR